MVETLTRFINFLIDTLIYFTIVILFLMFFKDLIPVENVKWVSALIYFLYYFLFEYLIGKTPGKFLTKSKVVTSTMNGNYYSLRILLRSLTRFIPFDIFSYLFTKRGLHDWISMTSVVKGN